MFVKVKSLFLKENIDLKELEKYGFITLNEGQSYWFGFNVGVYKDTRRFVYKYPKTNNPKKILKELNGLLPKDMLMIVPMYEWWSIIGRWQNYSDAKLERISKKLKILNKKLSWINDDHYLI